MNVKPTLRIAILAYNEEESIFRILSKLESQTQNNYKMSGIFVYSDGSTDSTVDIVRKNFDKAILKGSKINLGKNIRFNQIFKDNTSDILVQLDADIDIKSKNTIDNLAKKIINEPEIGIVCAYHVANKPKTFLSRLAYFGFEVWDKSRNYLGEKGIRYYCEGGLRAFSEKFAKNFRLPTKIHIGEDSYSFYYAIKNDYKVVVAKNIRAYIDLPETLPDYINQMKRFLTDPGMVQDNFGKNLTEKHETMSFKYKLKALINQFINQPVIGFLYILLQVFVKIQMPFYKQTKKWSPIKR